MLPAARTSPLLPTSVTVVQSVLPRTLLRAAAAAWKPSSSTAAWRPASASGYATTPAALVPMEDGQQPTHFKLLQAKHPVAGMETKRLEGVQRVETSGDEPVWDNPVFHEVWTREEMEAVQVTHRQPEKFSDRVALLVARASRKAFDLVTGYKHEGRLPVKVWLRRVIMLESIAGVPGMVAGMLRHMRSLRRMRRDNGWISTLLQEAENERMHLLVFLTQLDPGPLFRLCVLAGQGVFFNLFFLSYMVSPQTCHRFVGFIEEEAVITYTRMIHDMENGLLPEWADESAPPIAKRYWRLADDATFIDMIKAIRADEAQHRDVNHAFANAGPDQLNPVLERELKHRGMDIEKLGA